MPHRDDPRRWVVFLASALALLAVLFLVPAAWFHALFTPLHGLERWARRPSVHRPLYLLPGEIVPIKPEVVPAAEREPPPRRREPPREDPLWWKEVWRVHVERQSAIALYGRARPDSGEARRLELLRGVTSLVREVEPDSATASTLARLFLADGFRLGDLKAFLAARGYALDYQDLSSREAEMFDEHLRRSIPVTDTPDDKLRDEKEGPRRR
jgi:hypothetical protein